MSVDVARLAEQARAGLASAYGDWEANFAAVDALVAEIERLRSKAQAYDAARAVVKTEGNTRAFYVLRAERAEAERDALREAVTWMRDTCDVDGLEDHFAEACEKVMALAAGVPAGEQVTPLPAPGMTDLMVTPESIDEFLEEFPPPAGEQT